MGDPFPLPGSEVAAYLAAMAAVAVVCLRVSLGQIVEARRQRNCVLSGSAEYLLAADQVGLFRQSFETVIAVLLGDATFEEAELGLDPSRSAWDPVTGVVYSFPDPEQGWVAPNPGLPEGDRCRMVGERLAESGDVRLIRPLVDALWLGGRERVVALHALLNLLPLVQPGDAGVLHASSLYYHISHPRSWREGDAALAEAALDAVARAEHVGGLRFVQRLSQDDEAPPPVRAAAYRCAVLLREAAARHRAGARLLRSAELPASAESLLRPAAGADGEGLSLLRSASDASPD